MSELNLIDLDTIVLPDDYSDKYRDFVLGEARKTKRFLIDNDDLLYLSQGNGKVVEVTAREVYNMAETLDRNRLVTLWEVSPSTYHFVATKRRTQLVLRNEIVANEFVPKIIELYPNLINLRRLDNVLPILITPEYATLVIYNHSMVPSLIHDKEANIVYPIDGKRGVFKRVVEEVRKLLLQT